MTMPQTTLVTGATSGLGYELCRALAAGGGTVLVHGRDAAKAERAAAAIAAASPGARLRAIGADLGSLAGVRQLAEAVGASRLDCIVNNAGASFAAFACNDDGIERAIAVNHFAPLLLTELLQSRLAARAIVATVSSASIAFVPTHAAEPDVRGQFLATGYTQLRGYALSKLLNLAAMTGRARRAGWGPASEGPLIVMLDPGGIQTDFAEKGGDAAFVAMTRAHWHEMDTAAAVAGQLMALLSRDDLRPGMTYRRGAPVVLSDLAQDAAFQDRILDQSLAAIAAAGAASAR